MVISSPKLNRVPIPDEIYKSLLLYTQTPVPDVLVIYPIYLFDVDTGVCVPVICVILLGSAVSPTLTTTPSAIFDAVRFDVVTPTIV